MIYVGNTTFFIVFIHIVMHTSCNYMLKFQTTGFMSNDSFAKYLKELPEMENFTICFQLQLIFERVETIILSYAIPDTTTLFKIYHSKNTLRFLINGNIISQYYIFPMREWHNYCFSVDLLYGAWHIKVDNRLIGSKTEDSKFSNNKIHGGGNLILGQDQASLHGGYQKLQSLCGNIANLNIWPFTLNSSWIEEWSSPTEEDDAILKWSTNNWLLSGDVAKVKGFNQNSDIFAGWPKYGIVSKKASFEDARLSCINIQGKLAAPTTKEESTLVFDISKDYFNQCHDIAYLFLWLGYVDDEEEGVWIDATTRKVTTFEGNWGSFEPNGGREENCAAIFRTIDNKGSWSDFSCRSEYVLCFICEFDKPVKLTLKGLCSQSAQDSEFMIAGTKNGRPYFAGRRTSEIYFDPEESSGHWVINLIENDSEKGYLMDNEALLPIGYHDWHFSEDICQLHSQEITLIFTACSSEMYTCDDGSCIALSKRCDRRVECLDKSDENNCDMLEFPRGYQKETAPPPTVEEEHCQASHNNCSSNFISNQSLENSTSVITSEPFFGGLNVFLSVDIQAVPSIDTAAMVFTVDFQMTLEWKDSRLLFHNLKDTRDLNALSSEEKQKLWVPSISFGNAVGNRRSSVDADVKAYAVRMGQPMPQLHNLEQVYNGSEVMLSFSRKYDVIYVCDFDLHLYPFDSQSCLMGFDLLIVTKNRARLITNGVNFLGKKQLIEVTIGNISMTRAASTNSSFSSIQIRIEMIRESGFHLLTTYLPTSLMIFIAYLTFYFRLKNFTDRIMVSLTSLLVLASLLSQTSDTMPKTSYFKMVDVWLFSCIVTIFIIILFHTASIYIMTEEEQMISRSKKLTSQWLHPQRILNIGKIALPVGLIMFNIVYWKSAYAPH